MYLETSVARRLFDLLDGVRTLVPAGRAYGVGITIASDTIRAMQHAGHPLAPDILANVLAVPDGHSVRVVPDAGDQDAQPQLDLGPCNVVPIGTRSGGARLKVVNRGDDAPESA